MIFALLLCSVCTVFYTFVFFYILKRQRTMSGFVVVVGMYDVVYGILPLMIFLQLATDGNLITYIQNIIDTSYEGILALVYHYVYALIGFSCMVLLYFSRPIKKVTVKNFLCQEEQNEIKATELTAWISLIVGAISLTLWSKAYGSIGALILQANRVRSGMGAVKNGLAFFKHPATVLLITAYLFFVLVINSKEKLSSKIPNIVGLIISVYLAYLFLMANDGRLTTLLFFVGFIWIISCRKKIISVTKTSFKLIIVLFVGMLFILKLDSITYLIRYGTWPEIAESTGLFTSVIKELIFLPLGGQVSVQAAWTGKVGITIFDDIMTGFFSWFPTKFKPSAFIDVWNTNTYLIYGNLNRRLHGQVPCGIITQGYYDMRLFGVVIVCAFVAFFVKSFDKVDVEDFTAFQYAIGAKIILTIFRAIPYFSFYDIILGFFPIVEIILIKYFAESCIKTIRRRKL